MRIEDMIVTPIALIDPPLLNAAGLHAPYALRVIVELVTDNGLYGLGEVPGGKDVTEALTASRSLVIGKDPYDINLLHHALISHVQQADGPRGDFPWDLRIVTLVRSAIEVACLDLIGKHTSRPLVDLLGGSFRDKVPFSAYLFYKHEGAGGKLGFGTDANANGWSAARQAPALDPAGVVAQAKAMCDTFGFESLKLKGGVFSPDQEVAAMHALYEAFGKDVPFRLDPNALWSVETAITYGHQMEGILEYYEDPVRGQQNMAAVRRAVKMPLATNMCTTSFADMPGSIATGSEDIILSDHHAWGGILASVQLAKMCEVFGRGVSMHSNSHAGISLAAMVHLAAAVPNVTYACDTHYPWQSEDVLVGGQLAIKDGCVAVPDKPGLGVELDRAELARLHQQYLDSGLTRRDDAIEMKKVDPAWEFKPTRW